MNFHIILEFQLLLIIFELPSQYYSEESLDLCANPVISTIDRMWNGSVRIYRGGYFWDLYGLPDRVGTLTNAQKIDVPFLGPVSTRASIVSISEGNRKAYVYKFEQGRFWAWMSNGYPFKTKAKGNSFTLNNQDFDAVFHNEKEDEPLFIALKGRRVFYFSTKEYEITAPPNYDLKGYEGGRNGENFPNGVEAAISWPPLKPEDGYYVFLFKGDKYCRRKEKQISGQDCDEWRDNKELFGCLN